MVRKKKSNLSQYLPFLLFFVFCTLIGITFFVVNSKNSLRDRGFAATPVSNRILWQGNNWYLHGANVPWYNWACDFGCNSLTGKSGGVSTNTSTLGDGFAQAQKAGMHTLRWWVFPGDAWQIERDSSGAPLRINPAVYTDIDAAITLAQQYDMYYNFVLFSAPTHIPVSWQTDATQRAKLASVLGTLFARYKDNPRIISWEIYNEPENDIWNNRIAEQPVVDTGTAIAQSVHTNAPGTLVTVGSLFADGMKMWLNAGLDYYSPHWYDYMSGGDYCIICHNYDYYASWGVNKPIVVGEFFTGTPTTSPYSSTYRYDYFYNNGFAGTWGWSIFPGRTSDNMAIDLTSAATFASNHIDIGPLGSVPTGNTELPTPTPTPYIINATPTPNPNASIFTLSNVGTTNITSNQATISWTTSEPATSNVQFGTSKTNLNFASALDPNLTTNHKVVISGLNRATRYFYRVRSSNAQSTEVVSLIYNFRTKRR